MTVRTVRLYGVLGRTFGRSYRLAVASPAEAVRALCVQVPGFERFLMQSKDKGLGYAVFDGRKSLREEHLLDTATGEIRIAPMVLGAKRGGIIQIIAGVVLIVASYFTGGATASAGMKLLASGMASMGVSMIMSGIAMLLTRPPKGGPQDKDINKASHVFNGPVNTQVQGNPVPYAAGGPMFVGSAVISAGIRAEDVYAPTGWGNTGGSGGSGGGGGGGSPPWHDKWHDELEP